MSKQEKRGERRVNGGSDFPLASKAKPLYIEQLTKEMSDLNKWIGVGRLTADAKSQPPTKGSGPMTTFTIAVNEQYRHGAEQKQSTAFVPIVTLGNMAENCAKILKKGRQVLVEGKLRIEQYEDKDHGKHGRASVWAETIQFLGERSSAESRDEPRTQPDR
jgi:single-strand DNA-binding protein